MDSFGQILVACTIAITMHGCVHKTLDHAFRSYPKVECVK